jgi:hypothetical protein
MFVDLDYRPHKWQQQIHDRARRFTVVVAHRRFGKTFCAIRTLIHAALATNRHEARYAYVAPFLKQAKRTSWDYLKEFSRPIPGINIREGDLIIEYPNHSRVMLFGADNPEAMRGIYLDGVVPDEMADFRPDVWGSIIRPTLADRAGWAFFIGTPKGVNQFKELYDYACNGKDGIKNPDWAGMMFRVDETHLLAEAELESARGTMSEAQYRQEFLCDFSASMDNVLITIDMVSAACRKIHREDAIHGLPKIIGVDVARFGDDRTVIQRRQGLAALEPIVYNGLDNMQVVGRLTGLVNEWHPDAIFIDAGRGEGVIDRMRQLKHGNVIEVNFGGKPDDIGYVNKRSEMWDTMKKWIEDGGSLPNHSDLKTDLCVPTYYYDRSNRFMLEAKDDIKKRGMRSPDIADALALTFAFPVAPQVRRSNQPRTVVDTYNPHADLDRLGQQPYGGGYDPNLGR